MLEEMEEEDGDTEHAGREKERWRGQKVCSARRGFVSTKKKHHSLLSKALSDTSRPQTPSPTQQHPDWCKHARTDTHTL